MSSATSPRTIEIVEVSPRDGFQPIVPWIETATKIALIQRLAAAGLQRIEISAFVSPSAVPQMRDAQAVLAAASIIPGLRSQVLVPTAKHGRLALAAGARHLVYVVSASESHNWNNLRRTIAQSAQDYVLLMREVDQRTAVRLNVATAFDCPFEGRVAESALLRLAETLVDARSNVELALCDTTGRATPDHVARLCGIVLDRFPETPIAFHGHDTYGLGVANALAAFHAGIDVLDASAGGLGGCPFAPGATGNVATEDLVWMFGHMGIETGVDLNVLVGVADELASLPGASCGGRVRDAMRSATKIGAACGWESDQRMMPGAA